MRKLGKGGGVHIDAESYCGIWITGLIGMLTNKRH